MPLSNKRLRLGIIGAGRIGRVHAGTLAFRVPEALPVAITDIDRQAAEHVAARCGVPSVAPSSAEILADPSYLASNLRDWLPERIAAYAGSRSWLM